MIYINENIGYLPKQQDPLSAEVFIIHFEDEIFIYDVGNGKQYANELLKISQPKNVVLSHFHPDHIYNLSLLDNFTLFQSKHTAKYTKNDEYQSALDGKVKIYEIPSSHAKGCLGLEVNGYLFVGDAFYMSSKRLYNANAVNAQIKLLKKDSIQYVICSHHEPLIRKKENVLNELENIYTKREKNKPFIEV